MLIFWVIPHGRDGSFFAHLDRYIFGAKLISSLSMIFINPRNNLSWMIFGPWTIFCTSRALHFLLWIIFCTSLSLLSLVMKKIKKLIIYGRTNKNYIIHYIPCVARDFLFFLGFSFSADVYCFYFLKVFPLKIFFKVFPQYFLAM